MKEIYNTLNQIPDPQIQAQMSLLRDEIMARMTRMYSDVTPGPTGTHRG